MVALVAGVAGIPATTAAHDVDREFLAVKVPFRHVWVSPLPTTSSGDVDVERLLLEASGATLPATLLHLESSLDGVAEALRVGDEAAAASQWRSVIAGTRSDWQHTDVNALVAWVLREAYMETSAELRYYAQKADHYDEQKRETRDQLSSVEEFRSSLPPSCQEFSDLCELVDDTEVWIDVLGLQLDGLEEDAELANVDLQNVLQKQQQTVQSMSNAAKMLHDTAMTIIGQPGR